MLPVVSVWLIACASEQPDRADPSASTGPLSSSTAEVTTTTPPAMSYEDLAGKLVPSVGDLIQPSDTTSGRGPLDLNLVAGYDAGADGIRATLADEGFVRGLDRHWRSPRRDENVDLYVFQFETHGGAVRDWRRTSDRAPAAFADQAAQLGRTGADAVPVPFAVAGLPSEDALGYLLIRGAVAYVTYAVGPYRVEIGIQTALGVDARTVATAVAVEQHARLR